MSSLLTPDNAALFREVRKLAAQRDPVISWEDIARQCGLDSTDVPALVDWFVGFKLPTAPKVMPTPDGFTYVRDPQLRAERLRLRRREESLITLVTEAPAQLERVQRRIQSIERAR